MMQSAKGRSRTDQVQLVNSFFNRLTYRTDAQEYGQAEHWATPAEFMSRGAGDCEDYAAAKFFSLRLLGVADQDLRVVALNDRIARIGHAVATVNVGGTRYVLDNRTDQLFPDTRYSHYQPVVSMNETGEWRNVQAQQPKAAKQLRDISSALTFR
jgi:predicted transglutaminase-like cysteine proteinase